MAEILARGAYDVLIRGERKRQGYKYVVRAPWTIELGHNYGHFACHHQRYDAVATDSAAELVRKPPSMHFLAYI